MNDGHKLRVKWRGPQRITRAASDFVFEVEDLITNTHALIHANRLKFYADSQLDLTETLLDTVAHNNPHYNTVQEILDLRFDTTSAQYQVQGQWIGFDYEEPTWEPFENMVEDIPVMLERFLSSFSDQEMATAAKAKSS